MTIQNTIDPLSDWDNLPAQNTRIGYENLLTGTTSGTSVEPMLTANTYEKYRPLTGTFTLRFQPDTDSEVDYIGLAAHNLSTQDGGISVLFSYATTVGGSLTDIEEVSPSSNAPIMILFDPITVAEIAMTFTTSSNGLELGVIFSGKVLQMYQPIYGGHRPITLNSTTTYQGNQSESGNFLGRNIIRRGQSTQYNYKNLDPDWYRNKFEPFVESAKSSPFFIMWRPDMYPDEVAYGEVRTDIGPSNSGGGITLMAVSFPFVGHADL